MSWNAVSHWPLYIGPRSLSILARVLLGRQESCREAEDECDDESCVTIWKRIILTLKEMAFNERKRSGMNNYNIFLCCPTVKNSCFFLFYISNQP